MMKKLFTLIMTAVVSVTLQAQTNPTRILVSEKSGQTTGYLAERVDSVWFDNVEGRIAAAIDFKGYKTGDTGDTLTLGVTRSSGCEAFRIGCLPASRADRLSSEAIIASYLDQNGSELYWQDFTNAEMTGFEFDFAPDTKYTILTVGYDKYGIACGAERVDFTTPKKQLVGDCGVTYTIDEVSQD